MKKNYYAGSFYLLMSLLIWHNVNANLNGTIDPIFVENSYTFTSGERADGFVYFKNGFDIPINGTVTLNLAVPVSGTINFNGGTLRLENHLVGLGSLGFKGPGFIWTIPFGLRIEFPNHLFALSNVGEDFIFLGPSIYLHGNGTALRFGFSGFDFSRLTSAEPVKFVNMKLSAISNGDLFDTFTTDNNQLVEFVDCTLLFGLNTIFNAPRVRFEGTCRLIAEVEKGQLTIKNHFFLGRSSDILIDSGFRLNLSEKTSWGENASNITFRNAQLYFESSLSPTVPITLGGAGNIFFEGASRLNSSNQLIIGSDLNLLFLSGSRMALDFGTHVKIE